MFAESVIVFATMLELAQKEKRTVNLATAPTKDPSTIDSSL